jgi:hypothetical protein
MNRRCRQSALGKLTKRSRTMIGPRSSVWRRAGRPTPETPAVGARGVRSQKRSRRHRAARLGGLELAIIGEQCASGSDLPDSSGPPSLTYVNVALAAGLRVSA